MLALTLSQLVLLYRQEFPDLTALADASGDGERFRMGLREFVDAHRAAESEAAEQIRLLIDYDGRSVRELSTDRQLEVKTLTLLWQFLTGRLENPEMPSDLFLDLYHLFRLLDAPEIPLPSPQRVRSRTERWPLGAGRRGAGHPRRQPRTDAPPADPEDREPQVEDPVALPVRRRHDLRGEVPAGGRLVGRFPLPAGDGREKPLGTEPLSGGFAFVGDDVSAYEGPQRRGCPSSPRPITFRCSTSRATVTTMPPSAVTFSIPRSWSKPTGRSAPGSARTSSRPENPTPPGGCCPTGTTSTAVTRRWRS